ncbi:MAG TPA: hypothetical protein VFK80_05990 [Limnochordia bacterium]|nr:hypothetical protein [Limnochordia bacterium]
MISLATLAVAAMYGAGLAVWTPYWNRFGLGEMWGFIVTWTLACTLAYYAAAGGTLFAVPLWLNQHVALIHPSLEP